ncbi:hypothetical protein [Sphingomonas sp. PB1R3]|uniref:hypothetical protein n=1 Tax=Sphingomonas flavida TaxID=3096154 RepID=UPI002FC9074E
MTPAFHGDPAVKSGMLEDSEPPADAEALATRAGLPIPVAALLLALTERVRTLADGEPFLHAALKAIPVGADLSRVANGAALVLLDAPELAHGPGPAVALLGDMRALHRRSHDGDVPDRTSWKTVRAAVLALPPAGDRQERSATLMCEAACWPADNGQSTLPAILRRWVDLAEIEATPDWSAEDDRRSQAVLERLWEEAAPAREAGEVVRYPALFLAAKPDLCRRYEAHLTYTNRRVGERAREFAAVLLRMLADVPVR